MTSCISYTKGSREARVKDSMDKSKSDFKHFETHSKGTIWQQMSKQIFDTTGKLKREIRSKLGQAGERIIRGLELSAGGSAKGDVHFQNAFAKVFRGLNEDTFGMLNEIIQARRNIALETNRVAVARKFLNDNAIGSVFDLTNEDHINTLTKKYGVERLNKPSIRGERFVTIRKKSSKSDSNEVIMEAHHTQEIAELAADRHVREVLAAADILNPTGLSAEDYQAFLDHMKKNDKGNYDTLNARADNYFAVFKSQLGHMRRAGLIDEATFNHMKKVGDYSPRRYIQFLDPNITFNNLDKIDKGSTQSLQLDSALLMRDYIVRLHDRIARNEANISLYEYAKEHPGNGIAEVVSADHEVKDNETTITAMVDGKKVSVIMPIDIGHEWGGIDAGLDSELGNFLRKYSGAGIVRVFATGANPEFAISNFPRDIFFSWLRTREFSDAAPKALWQMSKQLAKVAKDVWHIGPTPIGRAADFLEDGGMMEFMTTQGALEHTLNKQTGQAFLVNHPTLRALEKGLSFLGQKTELWVRVALREQALDNGKDRKDATWIARSYLDFAQGGKTAKALDKGLPYLNATLQATRGLFSTLALGNLAGARESDAKRKENITKSWLKISQFMMLAGVVMFNNILRNPEAWDRMKDSDKTGSLNFMLPFGNKFDEKSGQELHAYVPIQLDQGQSALTSLVGLIVTNSVRAAIGTEGDDVYHKIARTRDEIWLEGINRLNPLSNLIPPLGKAILAVNDVNSYTWESISKKGEVSDKTLEQNPWTHPGYTMPAETVNDISEALTGSRAYSPERMRAVLDAFIPSSNSIVKLTSLGGRLLLDPFKDTADEKAIKGIISQSFDRTMKDVPFLGRIVKYTGVENLEQRAAAEKGEIDARTADMRIRMVKNEYLDAMNNQKPTGSKAKDNAKEKEISRKASSLIRKANDEGLLSNADMSRHLKSIISAVGHHRTFGTMKNARLWRDVASNPSGTTRALQIAEILAVSNTKQKAEIWAQFNSMKNISNPATRKALALEMKKRAGN